MILNSLVLFVTLNPLKMSDYIPIDEYDYDYDGVYADDEDLAEILPAASALFATDELDVGGNFLLISLTPVLIYV